MSLNDRPIFLATRGSALALTQTNLVLAKCRTRFPDLRFEARVIKTTGDKLQTAPPDLPGMEGTKGLFTKELEHAMLVGEADLAVHSLKDLPTDLPDGLELRAVLPRADVRDVLIYRAEDLTSADGLGKRGLKPGATLCDFTAGATIATSSTRRQAQVVGARADLNVVPIRGNVGTRLQKLADRSDLDGLILAAAGLQRLGFRIGEDGQLTFPAELGGAHQATHSLRATYLSLEEMLPCVGQGAIGIEGRKEDPRLAPILAELNDLATWHCVTAERAFLHAMGGGCLSPVAAYAQITERQLRLRAVSFRGSPVRRTEKVGKPEEAAALGVAVAEELQ